MEQTVQNDFLGTEKLSKLMAKYAIPCILSLVVSALYNVVDQIFIGNSELSTLGNAATGVVFSFFTIAQAFAWCYGDGCAAFLNICQGKSDTENAHKTVGNVMLFTVITGLMLMAVFYPTNRFFLTLFGASEHSIDYAVEYFNVILGFFPVYMLSNMMNAVARADGSPSCSMISVLTGAAVNLFLDPLFIFVFKWGMAGAAWATVIGQTASLIVTSVYFVRSKTFRLRLNSFIPSMKALLPALRLGISSFLTQMTIVFISLIGNRFLVKYGALSQYGKDIPMAVMGIETKVYSLVTNVVVGIVLGCQPVISYNLGAKNYGRVKTLYRYILVFTLAIGAVATVVFECFPNAVVSLFGMPTNIPNPDDYWDFSQKLFRIFLMLCIFNLFVKMNSIFFQAAGMPVRAAISSLVRDVFCFIPLIPALTVPLGIDGILWASPISDAVGFCIALGMIITYFLKMNREQKNSAHSTDEHESEKENEIL